jgi:hypothetical protein
MYKLSPSHCPPINLFNFFLILSHQHEPISDDGEIICKYCLRKLKVSSWQN